MPQRDDQRLVVGRLDPDLVLGRIAGKPLRRALHDAQHVGGGGPRRRIQQPQPRSAHVLGDERRAVAEREVGPDGERVRQPIGADLPARGERRVWLARSSRRVRPA